MAKNKKSSNNTQKFNINNFLKHQVRKLPIGNCYINPDWQDTGVATIIITRKHINGCYSSAMYYVDLLCEGIRETHFLINKPEYELEEILFEDNELCSYALVHNIIWGAVDFADEIGLKPHENFVKTKYFLEEDTDEIEFVDIEFGKTGRPVVVIDNEDKRSKLIATLEITIGRKNFGILNIDDDSSNFDHLPLEFDALGFSSQEEMLDELLAYNSKEEVEEYFEVFFDLFEEDKSTNLNDLTQKYGDSTLFRIIETMYFIFVSDKSKEPEFQTLFAQLFFNFIPDSPYDIADEKITYEPIDLGYIKSEEENDAYIQLVNKVKVKKKNVAGLIKKQIEKYPDNLLFKGLLYKNLFEEEKFEKIKEAIGKDYNQNPEYLFFKLYYGELLIKEKGYSKIFEIFDGKTKLENLYPERDVFHITEFVGFHHFFIKLNLAMGKLETAVEYHNALAKYYVEGNEALMEHIEVMVLKAKMVFLNSGIKTIS